MRQDKIWHTYQTDPELVKTFKAIPRASYILKRIAAKSRVLNIGIGDGSLEELCLEKGIDIYSLDLSPETVLNLRKKIGLGEEKIKVGTCEDMPFDNSSFDYIVVCEVLEHLEDGALVRTVAEMFRILKNGGTILGTTPAEEDLLVNQVICPYCGRRFHRWGHFQSFSEKKLASIFSKGFNPPDFTRVYFSDHRYLNWKGKLTYVLKKVFMRLGVHGQNETYFFKTTKRG